MHIAICDDNIADRKQMERLLKRETDKRAATFEQIFTDSYGNATALLAHPRLYDLFYIDMCHTEGTSVTDIVNSLLANGIEAPIYLCCSDINYRELTFPCEVHFIDKPIKVADLADSLDYAQSMYGKAPSLIELRDDNETIYVKEEDILHCVGKGRLCIITLTDGRKINMRTELENLYSQWENHECLFAPNTKAIVNSRYVEKFSFGKVILNDGSKYPIGRSYVPYAKSLVEKYHP